MALIVTFPVIAEANTGTDWWLTEYGKTVVWTRLDAPSSECKAL
ncbi:MAG: hypothetical protein ACI9UN_004995 [Granulosicoccus sp.]|jgi:hypothetical protein